MPEVHRVILWFEKDPGDRFVGESEIQGAPLTDLQRLFGASATDPMYDCWPVGAEQVAGLTPYLAAPIKLDRYDYFGEADAID